MFTRTGQTGGVACHDESVPPTAQQARILDALVSHARPVILTEFQADSCIASTRIGLDVLGYFGIPAREYPLLVAAFNPEALALMEQGVPVEEIGEQTRSISPDDPDGPWSVGIGASPVPGGRANGWSGHLIIGSPELGIVADLSLDQGARPHKRLHLGPYWGPMPDPAWFTDPTARQFYINQTQRVLLVLDRGAVPDPIGYLRSPNWKRRTSSSDPQTFKRLTGQIIRVMKADLNR